MVSETGTDVILSRLFKDVIVALTERVIGLDLQAYIKQNTRCWLRRRSYIVYSEPRRNVAPKLQLSTRVYVVARYIAVRNLFVAPCPTRLCFQTQQKQ